MLYQAELLSDNINDNEDKRNRTVGHKESHASPLGYILDLVVYNIKPLWGGGRIKQSTPLLPVLIRDNGFLS